MFQQFGILPRTSPDPWSETALTLNAARRLRLIPEVRRARDFRLYTAGNRRLVDLWQYGGRAILGHTPPSVLREMKNTAERGLFAPLPNSLEGRFLKALSRLLPGRGFRVFPTEAALCRFLAAAGFSPAVIDPALSIGQSTEAPPAGPPESPLARGRVLWRPFLDSAAGQTAPGEGSPPESAEAAGQALIPVLPLPWTSAPWVLALSTTDAALGTTNAALGTTTAPEGAGELLSPVVLAAASRAVYDLIAALGRRRPPFPGITRALSGGGLWKRRGVYLSLSSAVDDDAYTALFRRFLDAGFLLPPGPGEPLILPPAMSPGEEAKLAALIAGGI
jgi:hypothetical protein